MRKYLPALIFTIGSVWSYAVAIGLLMRLAAAEPGSPDALAFMAALPIVATHSVVTAIDALGHWIEASRRDRK